ncbi:PSD1 and planctomycete cytochrome C domain-containing protein [Urbifossiella limnaea]|uniref:Planctomycete cytochrome C n=1 Tax=Urbifossiella limnaea TaxID=2528023 RepID=A0A517XLR8_9BACT|nr:PSD1 and planctomycete cytochrome C domain-containing protein [Urbifossiella limnaea]QDU18442.1 Planctomycete cytochrome C [Urbifossiella limnaea]
MPSLPRLLAVAVVCAAALATGPHGPAQPAAAPDADAEARAVLTATCVKCHGPTRQKGGLRLDSLAAATAKADSGSPAVVPGKAADSELIRRVTEKDAALRMPPGDTPLTPAQVAALRRWIDGGAKWPGTVAPAATAKAELVVTDEDRKHWAYRPLAQITPPAGAGNPVDRFVRAALAAKGLTPSPAADPRALIRRVTFDLTGLPPPPADVEAFAAAADRDAAYAALVDRLLASPQYGERWGRHWLDVARYADSGGYEGDVDRPTAFHYRDFVIRALNDDLPFDEFVRRQLAGDEYAPDDPRAVAATGFLAVGPSPELPVRLLEEERTRQRYIDLDDMVSTTGSALLGLSLGCARCHDHKFDPIPTRDYYRLTAALHSGDRAEVPLGTRAEVEANRRVRAAWDGQKKAAEAELKQWLDGRKKALGKGDADLRAALDDAGRARWDALAAEVAAVKRREPKALPAALAYRDSGGKAAPSWLFGRGDFHDRSSPVELGFVTVLSRGKDPADYWKAARAAGDRTDTTYQRRALADWITDADRGAGPLLARVMVNRVWQGHFGEGLVRTPNDFGARGDRPSHPELFEWLAADLVGNGWKLKRLHRTIVLSDTYRQGTAFDADKAKVDPDNRLLWRVRPKRLEAEALRDAMLAVSGKLNPEMYGPAFKPPIPADAMVARNLKNPYPKNVADGPAVWRRSVYLFHKRVIPYPLFQAFDAPDAQQCSGKRNITTVVPQALAVLNDPFVRARAADFADRLMRDADPVGRAYRLAFARPPTTAEREAGVAFLARRERDRAGRGDPKRDALADYCQVLFGLNEFIYVD